MNAGNHQPDISPLKKFSNELLGLIRRWRDEGNLCDAEIIGVMQTMSIKMIYVECKMCEENARKPKPSPPDDPTQVN